ncbi:MAG TPA: class I SAM-dependent methyltransferase [Acidimicrobiales bacterium]|nr:class I SAM-dependent methyltransferase [Acidimicrobiales bacterium]
MPLTDIERSAAAAAKGFLPDDEAEALHAAALAADGPFLEVGSYCGRSAVWLGAAARARDTVLFAVDHHRGSEENQAGWEWHDPEVVDPVTGRMDTLPFLRRTLAAADLEDVVVPVVGPSAAIGRAWATPLGLLFIDGGHGEEVVRADEAAWLPHVRVGGLLAIHDVFTDPAAGGRPPYDLYRRCLDSGRWEDVSATGSLRVVRRTLR